MHPLWVYLSLPPLLTRPSIWQTEAPLPCLDRPASAERVRISSLITSHHITAHHIIFNTYNAQSTRLPMAQQHFSPFEYPPLPAGVDAIRVLALAPGDFYAPLNCILTVMAFCERPRYVALSYTWKPSYVDNLKLPVLPHITDPSPHRGETLRHHSDASPEQSPPGTQQQQHQQKADAEYQCYITLSEKAFGIGHNLHLALMHLRSPVLSTSLWVDAIRINQADTRERNCQVSLISAIYTRAIKVIGWLGAKQYAVGTVGAGLFRTMSHEWKAGKTQYLASAVTSQPQSKIRTSSKPGQATLVRIAQSNYWSRLWVVQEVCLPRHLLLAYGSDLWTYEELHQWGSTPSRDQDEKTSTSLSNTDANSFRPMQRLFDTRAKRHTDMMRLEVLIERFANS